MISLGDQTTVFSNSDNSDVQVGLNTGTMVFTDSKPEYTQDDVGESLTYIEGLKKTLEAQTAGGQVWQANLTQGKLDRALAQLARERASVYSRSQVGQGSTIDTATQEASLYDNDKEIRELEDEISQITADMDAKPKYLKYWYARRLARRQQSLDRLRRARTRR